MITFSDFIHKYNLKNKAISNIKIQQVLSSLGLSDVGIYLRAGPFQFDIGIVNLHPSKGTHWVAYKNEKYFESYGCVRSMKLARFIKKRYGHWLYSESEIQGLTNKRDSFCGGFCSYIIYLTKVIGIDFI